MSDKGEKNWFKGLLNTPLGANVVKFLAIGIALGILFMNAPELFGVSSGRPSDRKPAGAVEVLAAPTATSSPNELFRLQEEIAEGLARSLSAVKGAGKVTVQVSLARGPAIVPVMATQTTVTRLEEKGPDNSTRGQTTETSNQNTVTVQDGNAQALAVLRRDPGILSGVLILAEGAWNDKVKEELFTAAIDALHVPAHKVAVKVAEGRGN